VEGRFLSLVPSSGAASARSSLDSAVWRDPDGGQDARSDAGGGGAGERAGRPSTAKRQLEQILRSKLDVRNIHISGEAAEAGWGGAEGGGISARSSGAESSLSLAGPGATASAAKSRLQSLLDGGSTQDAEVCGG